MARSKSLIEVNKFVAGLITDATPLTFPENASLDEENMVLNIDGSRRRRLGLDYEENANIITTTIATASISEPAIRSYKWENAGGNPEKRLQVVQVGNEIKIFDLDSEPLSSGLLYTYNFTSASTSQFFSYATVDGILVVATGLKQVTTFEFTAPSTFTVSNTTLLIRDLFGVEDTISVDLYDRLDVRPSTTTNAHTYNLRNSTWAIPRVTSNVETVDDTITHFYASSGSKFPSNSDSVNSALYADPNDADARTTERFFAADLVKNPRGSIPSPMGYFIIDALQRGASRVAKDAELRNTYTQLDYSVTSLPQDETPGGPTSVCEFAGRIFYAGFSGIVTGGDKRSPRMSSYILFTQLIRSVNDLKKCYQEGDPTNKDSPDVVATDGGYLRVNGAYGIKRLISVGTSLLVIATNGVWRVYGGSDYGFDATNYVVEKISDNGIVSIDSVVVVDNGIMFWGQDGIYHTHVNEQGVWVSDNISYGRIQVLYEDIETSDKENAKGAFDSFERRVRWLYGNRTVSTNQTHELILDINLKAFYINRIMQFNDVSLPRAVSPFKVKPYSVAQSTTDVQYLGTQVQVNGEDVVYPIENVLGNAIREVRYIVITQVSPVVKYTFASYSNADWRDWYSVDNVGVDAAAYCVTGYIADAPSGKDFVRGKQIPQLFVHSRRTENGFVETIDGDLVPRNQSSCLVQTRWEWSDSDNSKRWGEPFQAYRYKRAYYPEDANDMYDTGYATVVTKNRLRGKGKVLSLKFSTEPYRDLHLYGWSMVMSVKNNV